MYVGSSMDQQTFSGTGTNVASSSDITCTIDQLPALYMQNQHIDNAHLFGPSFPQNEPMVSPSVESLDSPFDETEQKPDFAKISKGKILVII